MKRLTLLCYLLLSTLPALAENAAQDIEACDQALQAGDHALAVRHAEQALSAMPEQVDGYLCLGRALGLASRPDEAVAALKKAERLSTQPLDHIVALTLLGNQHLSTHAYQAAAEAYRHSLDVAREAGMKAYQRINLNLIGTALQGAGDATGALEHYQQAMKFAANDNERADGNARLASAYSLLGQHDKAIGHQLQSLLQQERVGEFVDWANASIELGRICLVAKEYRDAEKWLGKFLVVVPQARAPYWEAKGRYWLGRVKAAQGKTKEAAEQFAKGRALLADAPGATQLIKEIADAEADATTM